MRISFRSFALVRVRMVVRVGAVAPVEGIRVLRQVVHARHGRSGAAGVESGAGGKVKSALVGLVLGGQDDVLRHGIIGQHAHHVGTHRARDHTEEIDAESLRRRAGVIIGRVQLDAVGHLVGQHSGNLVHVAVQSHYETFVHRDVIRREAGRVEFRTVVHVPAEGEGTDIQHVVAAFHQPFHHFPDDLMVHGVAVHAVLVGVIEPRLFLIISVVPRVHDRGEITAVHARCAKHAGQRSENVRVAGRFRLRYKGSGGQEYRRRQQRRGQPPFPCAEQFHGESPPSVQSSFIIIAQWQKTRMEEL